jgi:F-type H+-transporting ATPase subunit delta
VSATESFSHGIAGRYATALFELAKEAKKLPALEKDVDALSSALDASADLRQLIASPVHTRDEQGAAMAAIGKKLKLGKETGNTVALMAAKRRLFALPSMLASVTSLIAHEKGEVTADVTSAKALTAAQSKKLADTLKKKFGKDIKINATVDEKIIGGLIVKVGSKMIDSSIATKLSKLQNVMKEVG